MKARILSVAAASVSSLFFASFVFAQAPELVPAPVETVFSPLGFDDNDIVEIVSHGHFPSTCYKTGPASAAVDTASRRITVQVQAYKYRGVGCATVMVPFTQSIKLGALPAGTYSVDVAFGTDAATTDLIVTKARATTPDDFLYAPVANVNLERRDELTELSISGEFPLLFVGCMVMRDLQTRLTPGGVLVVQPIAAIVDGPACDPDHYSYSFSIRKGLAGEMPTELLAHVRVLNGESVNRLFVIAP